LPLISAIIPARNEEASIAHAVESVAAQPEVEEVIVVNDQSTDRTGEILQELARGIQKLKVLATGELPPGWIGKNYAASLGAAAARGEWLLFTDADTYHYPGAARRALSDAADRQAVLVSYSPEQEMHTFWERALIPFVYCRLGAKFSYGRVNNPELPDAAANGQFILILREVYEAIGGHGAVADKVLEDVALARRVKGAGYTIYFTAPIGIVRTRMYRSFGAMWEGWTKNLYQLFGANSRALPWQVIFAVWPLILAALVMVPLQLRLDGVPLNVALAAIILLWWHVSCGIEYAGNLLPRRYILYLMPGACLFAAALVASWWKNTHGAVVWKGREYRARA